MEVLTKFQNEIRIFGEADQNINDISHINSSTVDSNALTYMKALFAFLGVLTNIIIICTHFGAICFARRHFFKETHVHLHPTSRKYFLMSNVCHFLKNGPHDLMRRLCSYCACNCRLFCLRGPKIHVENTSHIATFVKMPEMPSGNSVSPALHPGVTIIKPLAGLDQNIENNLKSYFELSYPTFEIIFCVAEETDPSCDIVRRLQSMYPYVASRLLISKQKFGVNPKINNLQTGYNNANYQLLLVSDAGVWMRPDTLSEMVSTMNADIRNGLVHQLPFVTPYFPAATPNDNKTSDCQKPANCFQARTSDTHGDTSNRPPFSWIVQLVFFGCWHAKVYLTAALFRINCTTGMSCLLKKPVLDNIGGFKRFGRYLAEDFFLSKYYRDNGWKVSLSRQPAWQNSPATNLGQFQSRLDRWSQLRLHMVPCTYFFEPLSHFFPNALIGAFSFAHFFPEIFNPYVYILCYFLLWLLLDYWILLCIYPPCCPLAIGKLDFLIAWLFNEVKTILYHFRVLLLRDVSWRNKRYRLHWGGLTEEITPQTDHLVNISEENYYGNTTDVVNTNTV